MPENLPTSELVVCGLVGLNTTQINEFDQNWMVGCFLRPSLACLSTEGHPGRAVEICE
jgi:hypothetical protein